jgi:hypothetical protein
LLLPMARVNTNAAPGELSTALNRTVRNGELRGILTAFYFPQINGKLVEEDDSGLATEERADALGSRGSAMLIAISQSLEPAFCRAHMPIPPRGEGAYSLAEIPAVDRICILAVERGDAEDLPA